MQLNEYSTLELLWCRRTVRVAVAVAAVLAVAWAIWA